MFTNMVVSFAILVLFALVGYSQELECVSSVTEIRPGVPVKLTDVVIPREIQKFRILIPRVCDYVNGVMVKMCDPRAPHLRVDLLKSVIHLKRESFLHDNSVLSVTVFCESATTPPTAELLPVVVKN